MPNHAPMTDLLEWIAYAMITALLLVAVLPDRLSRYKLLLLGFGWGMLYLLILIAVKGYD